MQLVLNGCYGHDDDEDVCRTYPHSRSSRRPLRCHPLACSVQCNTLRTPFHRRTCGTLWSLDLVLSRSTLVSNSPCQGPSCQGAECEKLAGDMSKGMRTQKMNYAQERWEKHAQMKQTNILYEASITNGAGRSVITCLKVWKDRMVGFFFVSWVAGEKLEIWRATGSGSVSTRIICDDPIPGEREMCSWAMQ